MQPPTPDLAQLASALRSGVPLTGDDCALAAAVLEDAAERHRPALAARLRRDALQQRNGLIFDLGAKFFPGSSLRARARALIAAARAYEQGEWPHHRALAAPPDCIVGTCREGFWRCFKVGAFPLGQRMIETLLK